MPLPGNVQVEAKFEGVHENGSHRVLYLPAGTVLAYQVVELAVSDEGSL